MHLLFKFLFGAVRVTVQQAVGWEGGVRWLHRVMENELRLHVLLPPASCLPPAGGLTSYSSVTAKATRQPFSTSSHWQMTHSQGLSFPPGPLQASLSSWADTHPPSPSAPIPPAPFPALRPLPPPCHCRLALDVCTPHPLVSPHSCSGLASPKGQLWMEVINIIQTASLWLLFHSLSF